MRRLLFSTLLLATTSIAHADLIAFYPFDDEANPRQDVSGNNTPLNLNQNSPVYVVDGGYEGNAFSYSGNDNFSLGINFNDLGSFTVGGWVFANPGLASGLYKWFGADNGGFDVVAGLDNRGTGGAGGAPFRFTTFLGTLSPNIMPGTPDYVGGQWVFMAITSTGDADSSGTVTLYIDTDAATHADALQTFSNGASFNGSQTTAAVGGIRPDLTNEGWQGRIDNVFVFNEVLSAERITEIRNGGAAAVPEPSTWGALLLGLAFLGIACCRSAKS